jgi:hypothetical protein
MASLTVVARLAESGATADHSRLLCGVIAATRSEPTFRSSNWLTRVYGFRLIADVVDTDMQATIRAQEWGFLADPDRTELPACRCVFSVAKLRRGSNQGFSWIQSSPRRSSGAP